MLVLSIRGVVVVTEASLAVQVFKHEARGVALVATDDVKIIRFDVLERMLTGGLRALQRSPQELPALYASDKEASEKALAELKASYRHALNILSAQTVRADRLFYALMDPNVFDLLVEFHA